MVSFVFHGDDISASRTALLIKLAEYKKQGVVIETIDGSKLDDLSMENLQASQELFGDPKVFLIENAHAGHKSKKRDELIKTLQDLDSEIVLWDKKKTHCAYAQKFSFGPSERAQ